MQFDIKGITDKADMKSKDMTLQMIKDGFEC